MKVDSAIPGHISKSDVINKAKRVLDTGGHVREAFIQSASVSGYGKEVYKQLELDRGIAFEDDGELRVFFADKHHNYYDYLEINRDSLDVKVKLGDSLNEAAFNYVAAEEFRKQGLEVVRVREAMPMEMLVEYGKPPEQVHVDVMNKMQYMHEKFGTPHEVIVPEGSRNEKGYQKLLAELDKLSTSLDKQFEYAVGNDAMPKYRYGALSLEGDEYKQFKRDIAKNVARSHTHGMLFTLEGVGDSGMSISVQAPNGTVVGSLTVDSGLDAEHFECNMVIGEPVEVEVRSFPDISKMSQKGHVSDDFRRLVSEMRKDFAIVTSLSSSSDLVSDRDISEAVSSVSRDVKDSGRSPLLLDGTHPDIVSAKLTYLLSQKYPDIVAEGIAMVAQSGELDKSFEDEGLVMK